MKTIFGYIKKYKIRFVFVCFAVIVYLMGVLVLIRAPRQEIHLSGSDIIYPEPEVGKLYATLNSGGGIQRTN